MVAGGLLAVVTAMAMAAYVAQVKLTHTQEQASNATDAAREAIRLLGNDVRSAAPGISAAIVAGGASQLCTTGTIPFDPGGGQLACLPPIFRSATPLAGMLPNVNGSGGNYVPPAVCLGGEAASAGFNLTVGPTQVEPNPANNGMYFCPDDLVIVATDTSNSFYVSGLSSSSIGNVTPAQFALMQTAATTVDGFDTGAVGALVSNPMVLLTGGSGPVLLCANQPCGTPLSPPAISPYAGVTDAQGGAWGWLPLTLSTPQYDLFGNIGTGTPVALPARLVQYAIEPVDSLGNSPPVGGNPIVSANLVRSELLPTGNSPFLSVLGSTVLVKGVIDMQVEFGYDPTGNGQLQYVSSGGYQKAYWQQPNASPTPPTVDTTYNTCLGGAAPNGVSRATCFPNQNFQYLRSVRINLLARIGTVTNSRSQGGLSSAAGTSAPFLLQPAVQDIDTGNVEAQNWKWQPGGTFQPFATIDGAEYREISTEISIRNLALSANY